LLTLGFVDQLLQIKGARKEVPGSTHGQKGTIYAISSLILCVITGFCQTTKN